MFTHDASFKLSGRQGASTLPEYRWYHRHCCRTCEAQRKKPSVDGVCLHSVSVTFKHQGKRDPMEPLKRICSSKEGALKDLGSFIPNEEWWFPCLKSRYDPALPDHD